MLAWVKDENAHLRRLASEGLRPRLPWARRLRGYQHDPRPVLAVLELLKDDPERYVQRSVANDLNDIAKDPRRLHLRHAGDGPRTHQRVGRGQVAMRCVAWSRPVTVKRFAFSVAKKVHAFAFRMPSSHSQEWPWVRPCDSPLKWKAWRVVRSAC